MCQDGFACLWYFIQRESWVVCQLVSGFFHLTQRSRGSPMLLQFTYLCPWIMFHCMRVPPPQLVHSFLSWGTLGYFSPDGHFEESCYEMCGCAETWTPRFPSAVFIRATLWSQPKESTAEEWVRKMWNTSKAESCSAIKSKALQFSGRWTLLETIM